MKGTSTEWDIALLALDERKQRLAAHMLLDALCLDSQAGALLEERADLLFANNGVWLNRLLLRFLYIGTLSLVVGSLIPKDKVLAPFVTAWRPALPRARRAEAHPKCVPSQVDRTS